MAITSPPFIGTGVKPQVTSAEALSTTSVQVSFNEAMSNNAALKNASNYTVSPTGGGVSRSVTSATPESGGTPRSVRLLLNGALSCAEEYIVIVDTAVEDLAGNTLDPTYVSALFIAKWSSVAAAGGPQPTTLEDNARKEKMITWLKSRDMLSSDAAKYIRRKRS